MKNIFNSKILRGCLIFASFAGIFAAILFLLPAQFSSEAQIKRDAEKTKSGEQNLENYDIRQDKNAYEFVSKVRREAETTASAKAERIEKSVRAENELRERVPALKIEYNKEITTPEVITPDEMQGEAYLTGASQKKRAEILREFVSRNNDLIGMESEQVSQLKVTADYTNPEENLSFARLEQEIGGVPVFRGEVKAGFTEDGKIIRIINNLAPGMDYENLSRDFGDAAQAVRFAAENVDYKIKESETARNNAVSNDKKIVFGAGDWATTAEKIYFPIEAGVMRTAWRVLIWKDESAYYVIVDAETGKVLWRKNIVEDQTQTATYNVYTNPNSMLNVADSPAPLSPGPIDPSLGTQGAILTKNNITLIGNELPYSFNNLGWLTDGTNTTDGNNVEAGLDLSTPDGVDSSVTGANRVFSSNWNPPPGNPVPGDEQTSIEAQNGAAIQMFYIMNRYHDEMYRLGFTEQAGNFQNDNFGRGGAGGDRISAEGQDYSGTNNAGFGTAADGVRGKMQMYIFTGANPKRDGTTDAQIIIHEATHGTSNRLHGNANGLNTQMSRAMGEGWSDFYAHAMLSKASDPLDGIYAIGSYVLLNGYGVIGNANYFYGIRRFPKAIMSATGGINNRPFNPLTFADIDNTKIDVSDGAFPAMTGPHISSAADQVHAAGEIWSSVLWEVRAKYIRRLGFAVGNRRILQHVTDAMKISPLNPTFLQARDAIIAVAATSSRADREDVLSGFAIRGMGFSASIQSTAPFRVTEAFDMPNVEVAEPGFSVSDAPGNNNTFPEPGENVLLTVPVTNSTGETINDVLVNVGGANVSYGNIADKQIVIKQIAYKIPNGIACGSFLTINISIRSSVGTRSETRKIRLGKLAGNLSSVFENTTPITIPDKGAATPYPSTINVSGLSGNKNIKIELTDISHTWVGDVDFLLEAPNGKSFIILSDAFGNTDAEPPATVTLTDTADFPAPEGGFSTGLVGGEFKPTNYGASTDPFDAPAPQEGIANPAPTGASTFASVFGTDGAAMNGVWKLYLIDDGNGDSGNLGGWKITFESTDFTCSTVAGASKARADFDGDGKTDLSVYRPAEGNWYINGSNTGFNVITWGNATDTPALGDYDGDGKADTTVFRPTTAAGTPDFYILNSKDFTLTGIEWGSAGDLAVVGDYDGDGKADPSIFRPSNNTWYILKSGGGISVVPFGQSGDIPAPGDYDGDGKTDLAVFRNGQWIINKSTGGTLTATFGLANDKLVPADYDGDGKDDIAVFRASNGVWYILQSTDGKAFIVQFGQNGDAPVPGDYDGDGKNDLGIYRSGIWYLSQTTSGISVSSFGIASDKPIPKYYVP